MIIQAREISEAKLPQRIKHAMEQYALNNE
jgi:hypothetical protein